MSRHTMARVLASHNWCEDMGRLICDLLIGGIEGRDLFWRYKDEHGRYYWMLLPDPTPPMRDVMYWRPPLDRLDW